MFKKLIIYIRTSTRLIVLFLVAILLIVGSIFLTYKPSYSVTINNEFVGYCKNKSELQSKINYYMENGNDENTAFVQIENLPEYKLCLIKRNLKTQDEEIYDGVIKSGVSYYRTYALVEDGQEKKYISNFEDAEKVVSMLKEKNSSNKDNISIVEKYDIEAKENSTIEDCVNVLYKEVKPIQEVKVASTENNTNSENATKAVSKKKSLGISLITPTHGTITSRFGIRSRDNHKGIDVAAPKGTPIKAASSGTVVHSGNLNDGYGNYIILSHGNGIKTYYAHCSSLLVKKGEKVSQGQVIAKVGSTGISTGNHLHFEIRINGVAQNPQNYLW